MKIIKGYNKSQFINDYCNKNKEIQFLLIDTIDNGYPFECENLLLFSSNSKDWLQDLKNSDDELPKDTEIFLFTNDYYGSNIVEYYKELVNKFNREIFIVLSDEYEAKIVYNKEL